MSRHTFLKSILFGLLMIMTGLVFASSTALAQSESAESDNFTQLNLGSDIQTPGAEAFVALSLDALAGVSVGTLASEITFPNQDLSFLEARRGLAAEAAGADISAVVKADPADAAHSILRLTVTTKGENRIPNGIVADLAFMISEEATLGTIQLENKPSAMTNGDPVQPIESLTGTDGSVEVSETPPVFVCFFYMH